VPRDSFRLKDGATNAEEMNAGEMMLEFDAALSTVVEVTKKNAKRRKVSSSRRA
jgi:hypothetical protein